MNSTPLSQAPRRDLSMPDSPATGSQTGLKNKNAVFLLCTLIAVVFLNYLDRGVIAILLEPIKAEFKLSDTQIGILTGFGFALFYATLTIPIARFAERGNRARLLAVAVLVWSAGTCLGGLASGFATLFFCRLMVGTGEAGGVAPSLSMLADSFATHRRGTAMALFSLGQALGAASAPLLGGWLSGQLGWRGTFMTFGVAGLPLALLLMLRLKDPRRGSADGITVVLAPLSFGDALRQLVARRSYLLLIPTMVMMALAEASMGLWAPSALHRSFGVDIASLGLKLSLFQGIPALIGTFAGGPLTDRLGRRDERWIVWVPLLGALLAIVGVIGMFVAGSLPVALAFLTLPAFVGGLYIAPLYALSQNLAAPDSRTTSTAILGLAANLFGAGLGPLLLGAISDAMHATYGQDSLRLALLALVPFYALASLGYYWISRHLPGDLARLRADLATRIQSSAALKEH